MINQILDQIGHQHDIYDIALTLDIDVAEVFTRIPHLVKLGLVTYDPVKLTLHLTEKGKQVDQIDDIKPVVEVDTTEDNIVKTPRTGTKKDIIIGLINDNPGIEKKQLVKLISDQLDMPKRQVYVYLYNIEKNN